LSIGFRTVKGRLDPKTRIRKLDVIDLWEISIVTFPLLPGARVHAVKEASSPSHRPAWTRNSVTRQSWPVDRSLMRFKPERLFRKEPRFRVRRQSEVSAAALMRP
jgi:hypothetical protein